MSEETKVEEKEAIDYLKEAYKIASGDETVVPVKEHIIAIANQCYMFAKHNEQMRQMILEKTGKKIHVPDKKIIVMN